jgi:hypothetical protein
MMDDQTEKWGDDECAIVRQPDSALVIEAEEAAERRYRLEIRDKFIKDNRVNNALVESKDCLLNDATRESVRGLLQDLIRPSTENIFDRVLQELLAELDAMQKMEPTAYLIDRQDGRVLMPVSDNDIYTPPDYTDEAGIIHPSKPILHPAIAAPLLLKKHDDGKQKAAIARAMAAGAPAAVEHIVLGPESILERAKTLLHNQGVRFEPLIDGERVIIEVGRERIDDMLQAPNYRFHRSQMYGSILAKKILDLLAGSRQCDLKSAALKKSSKEQWYEIEMEMEIN